MSIARRTMRTTEADRRREVMPIIVRSFGLVDRNRSIKFKQLIEKRYLTTSNGVTVKNYQAEDPELLFEIFDITSLSECMGTTLKCIISFGMEADPPKAERLTINQSTLEIAEVLKDPRVQELFKAELNLLPHNTYELYVAYENIYILINFNHYLSLLAHFQEPSAEGLENPKCTDIESKYAIKVSKNFPLPGSLKVHLLDGGFQPKICDCRDLLECIMGQKYHYKIHFIDIFKHLVEFDKKLHKMNELFQPMQKIGRFNVGEKYYYHELTELYSSLILFKDISQKKNSLYLGLTDTHVLVFKECQSEDDIHKDFALKHRKTVAMSSQKEIVESEETEETVNRLTLITCAEMQCIDTFFYKEHEKTIRIIFKKYQSIKLYHQFEEIKRQYQLNHPEVFLRGILKSITKFQACEVLFDPYRSHEKKEKKPDLSQDMVKHRQTERINFFIDESNRLQLLLKKQVSKEEKNRLGEQINKYYRKLIEFYSARANPYYLIYVNKLNTLYSKYYIGSQPKGLH